MKNLIIHSWHVEFYLTSTLTSTLTLKQTAPFYNDFKERTLDSVYGWRDTGQFESSQQSKNNTQNDGLLLVVQRSETIHNL